MIRQFNVSEARTAIACPRIFYFDADRFRRSGGQKRITRIWVGATDAETGCGKLFHDTIERFNRLAANAEEVRAALADVAASRDVEGRTQPLFEVLKRFIGRCCLNRAALNSKSAPQQAAFVHALDQYLRELATVLAGAVVEGHPAAVLLHEFFGDKRKSVDVTFRIGPHDEPVRLRGVLDYIYFDYRNGNERIIDYKLTPSEAPSKDLLQVALYALMHHQQHQTNPDAAVLYLHPDRRMAEHKWRGIYAQRGKVFDLIASMAAWSEYDEQSGAGLKPPGEPALCYACPWNRDDQCQRRLGPKLEGDWIHRWTELAAQNDAANPDMFPGRPPEPAPAVEYDDVDVAVAAAAPPHPSGGRQDVLAPLCASPVGLELGVTIAGTRPVVMPESVLPTHLAVMGAAGSGKSWLAKVVAEEAVRHGVPVLAIDPQGDLVQFLSAATLPAAATAEDREEQARFRECVEVRVWTPGTSHGQRLCLSPLRLPKEADLAGVDTPQRRREEWDGLLAIAAGNLVQMAQAGGDAEIQQTFVLELLRALTNPAGKEDCRLELSDIITALSEPESCGIEDPDRYISKREREKLSRKLNARARGPMANLFVGGTALDLNRFTTPVDSGKTPLNVVYLNAMPEDSQKQYFVAALAAEVYRWMITTAAAGNTRLLLFLDEAKDFLPAGASMPPAKRPLLRLFAQGRKFGVSCLICTQSPPSVDYQIFSNASTKLIGRLEAAQDVQRVAEWFTDSSGPPAWLPGRNGADNKTFAGRWPGIPADLEGLEFRSRRLFSLHEGAWSPERVEAEWARSPLYGRLG